MKAFKKILCVGLAALMIFASACGNEEKPKTTDPVKKPEPVTLERFGEMRGLTAAELVAEMKGGWNLGNSFDSLGGETNWGNPATTKEMIDAVAAKGFNTIRIPVTWGENTGKAPDYTIKKEWLDRVQEVVNYAIDNDMYVIINSHHEEEWRIPDNEHIDEVDAKHTAIWTQIAERFSEYGDHLVFEGLNEPRVKGGTNEWNGGTSEGRECVNRLNQSFVNAVRGTGSNNETRLLLITSFASTSNTTAIKAVTIPEDDKYIGMSIHAYIPYAFTYSPGESWELFKWDGSKEYEIDNLCYSLKENFVDKGIPVIITEYGAVNKAPYDDDSEVVKWLTYYLTMTKSVGIPCIWWDNGYYTNGNENFGIFDRNNVEWFSDEIADTIVGIYE